MTKLTIFHSIALFISPELKSK